MSFERGLTVRDGHPLAPLLDHTDMLTVTSRGKIVCSDKIDVPLDEYGIPQRTEFIRQVLGTVASSYIWTDPHDLHHLAWPEAGYKDIGAVGSIYRSAGLLKAIVGRQLHIYTHHASNPPGKPPLENMRQFALEIGQVERLYDTIKVGSYKNFAELDRLPFEEQEQLRQQSYQRKLEDMLPGEVGVMPNKEHLSKLHVSEARPLLRKIVRPQGISNSRKAKRQFFAASDATHERRRAA